jgi:hypothetical protein
LQRGPSTTNFNTIPNAALVTHTSGGGPAGLFLKPTAADNHPAILAQGLGSSPAAVFRQGDAFSSTIISGAAVHVLNGRMTGAGLNAQITNSANSSPALSASSSGSAGAVADFSSFSNGFLPTVFMQSNTSAQVLLVNHEGTGGRIARFQRDNPGTAGGGVEIDIVGTGVALDVVHRGTGRALDVEMNPPTDTICAYISNNHSGGRALRVENLQGTGGPFGGAALEVVGPALFSANPGLLALRTLGAVELNGSVQVNGVLCAETVCAEVKNFRIDHPLEPERKYLYHASIESSEMLNLYSGNVTTDAGGYATVELPEWFEALNTDFRYQLTVIGSFTQAIIAEKIRGGRFVVRTDQPGVEVSWQVTGVRHDAYARAHPLVVEAEKQPQERRHAFHSEVSQSAAHAAAQGSFHP